LREELASFKQRQQTPRATPSVLVAKESTAALASGLSQRKLGERLGVSHTIVGKSKDKGAAPLAEWSKEKDPDGLAWEFREGKYYPIV
jgi:hypothetical protein